MPHTFSVAGGARKIIRSIKIRPHGTQYIHNLFDSQQQLQRFDTDCILQLHRSRRADFKGIRIRYISTQQYLNGRLGSLRCTHCSMPSKLVEYLSKVNLQSAGTKCFRKPAHVSFSSQFDTAGTDSRKSGEDTSNLEELSKEENDDLNITTSIKGNDTKMDLTKPTVDSRNNSNHGQNNNPSFKVSRVSYRTGTMYVKYRAFFFCRNYPLLH